MQTCRTLIRVRLCMTLPVTGGVMCLAVSRARCSTKFPVNFCKDEAYLLSLEVITYEQ